MNGFPEPPATGTEAETLLGSLERQRATFAYKCADLNAEQQRRSVGASTATIGGLLKHLAYMEDLNFTVNLAGLPMPQPWAGMEAVGRGDRVWASAASDAPEQLYALWEESVERSRSAVQAALDGAGPSATFEEGPGRRSSLRRLLVDFIEEYGRHTGHADLIRESIDGRVGEDPPGRPYPFVLDGGG